MSEIRLTRAILGGLPVAALALDRRARVVTDNAAARALFGDSLTDRHVVTIIRHPLVIQAVEAALDPEGNEHPPVDPDLARTDFDTHRMRVTLPTFDGEIAADVTVSSLPAGIGMRGALIVVQDRTQLERAEEIRRDFVANVSHELRTPLTALMGFIDTLRGAARDDPKARDRFLEIMQREAGRMNRLVLDLLSLSRVESQARARPSEPVDLVKLVRGTLSAMGPAAEAAGVMISAQLPDTPMVVPGDADQLTQVMNNLVENALKYGGSGGRIDITLDALARDPVLRGPACLLSVVDYGEGIDPLHLPRLTERFYRVDTHRSRAQGGTGLGLAIVKHILTRHRGRLKIESEPGHGSRFSIILPANPARRG